VAGKYLSPAFSQIGGVDAQHGFPSPILWDGNYIWTASQDSPAWIERYNPVTRARSLAFQLGNVSSTLCQGAFAFDGTYYWIADRSANTLRRFDVNGNTLTPVALEGSAQVAVYDGAGHIMSSRTYTSTVYRIDTGTLVRSGGTISGASFCYGGCVYGGYYWATYWGPNPPYPMYLVKIDISTLTAAGTYALGYNNDACVGMCTDGSYIYLTYSAGLKKVRMSDGVVVGTLANVDTQTTRCVCYDQTYVWLTGMNGSYPKVLRILPSDLSYTSFAMYPAYAFGIVPTNVVLPYGA
jgi:hypothetical protein